MKKKLIQFVSLLFICCITAFGGVACKEDEPVHQHEYETIVTAPTCTEQGFTTYTCSCGNTYTDTYVSALDHEFTNYVFNNDAKCGVNGTETAICNRDGCNEKDTRTKENSALEHEFTNYVFNSDAKCGVDGTETARCEHADCMETDTRTKANSALNHKFTTYVFNNDAKCGVDGTETANCDNDGCTETDTRTKTGTALSHSFTNYVSDNNATYEKDGTKTAKCDRGCGKTDTVTDIGSMLVKNTLTFKTLTVNDTNVYGKVSNSTETFSFINEVVTSGKTKYIVSIDVYGIQQVASKTIPLEIGDNMVYITETLDGEPINVYTVTIRRKPIYTISFNTNAGMTVESQSIEEDAFATEPKTTKTGYTFASWDYDFTQPITEDKTVTASWTANTDTAYKVEYYLQNLDGGYTLQEIVNWTGTTDTTATADIKTFKHFTYNENNSTPSGNIDGNGTLVLQMFYTRNAYTVMWANYDGSVLMTEEVIYGEEPYSHVFLSPTRSNEGETYDYSFIGWSPTITPTIEDTVYTAQYEQIESSAYWVNYNTNGGTGEIFSQTKFKGESLTLRSERPTKDGYVFVGWNNLHEETVYQAGDEFTSDFHVTFFAMWEKTCETCDGKGWYTYKEYCWNCHGEGGWEKCSSCRSTVGFTQSIGAVVSVWLCRSCGNVGTRTWVNCSQCSGGYNTSDRDCTACTSGYIKENAPTAEMINARSVVLTQLDGYEYSLDGTNWQESNVFEGLHYSTQYTFYQRVAKTKTTPFGTTSSGLTVTTAAATEFYVSYVLNGGANDCDNPSMYSVFDGNLPLNAPTKEYYDFTGWSYKGNIVTKIDVSWAEDIELTATWKPTLFSITYELNGGNTTNPNEYHIESEFTLSPPIKEGYTFLGWSGSNGDMPTLSVSVSLGTVGELYYTAHWCVNQYTISFVLNNGESMDSITQDYGSELSMQNPVWEKHTFIGWFDSTLTSEYQLATMPAENITLYAKWRANEYIVTYNANGGVSSKDSDLAFYGEYYTLATAERTGYTFKGWYTDGVRFNDGVWAYEAYDQVVALTAHWEIITYSITYELNGGTANNATSYTVEDTLVLNQPKKTGYTFTGWAGTDLTAPNPTLTILKGSIGDRNYTANWQANEYAVTYNANGGISSKDSDTAIYDENFTLATAERTGYTFDGWYNGTVQYTDGIWDTASPITLKAKWTANEYAITYDPNGGTVFNTEQTVTYDIAYTLYVPTRSGYTFLGWTNHNEEFISGTWRLTENVSLIAKWQANEYTLSFNVNGGEGNVESITVTYDQAYSVPTVERIGYAFEGWYNGSTEYFGGVWLTTSDITLTAKWTAYTNIPYVVNHYLQNIEDDNYTLTYSEDFTGTADAYVTPTVKVLEGFTLPLAQSIKIEPDGSQVLEYYYARNSYTISFISNGGSFVDSVTAKYQTPISLSDSVREAYTFGGWFMDVGLNEQFTETSVLAKSITLYAWWLEENKPGDFAYSGSSEIKITSYVGTSTTICIPMYIDNIPVTAIADSAFYNCDHLTRVKIPYGITKIGSSVFYDCNNLVNVLIPESVTYIDRYAFVGCNSLTNIIVPNSVTYMAEGIFSGCSSLTSITLPFVGGYNAASGKAALFGYIFGTSEYDGGVKTEQSVLGADGYYTGVAYYYIPAGLKSVTILGGNISNAAFENCSNLTEITLSNGIKSINPNTFSNCNGLKKIIIPDSVTTVGRSAFYGCSSLTEITIPDSVISIAEYAFSGCSSLINLTLPFVGEMAESTKDSFGKSNTYFGYVFGNGGSFGGTMTAISQGDYTFYIPKNLRSVTIMGVDNFYGAFENCHLLTKITLPSGITSIDARAFHGCSGLTSITIPDSVTSIGSYAFRSCRSLTSVAIPDGVTSIGERAFDECNKLVNVTIPDDLTIINAYTFNNCNSLTSVMIPDRVTSIGDAAFSSCNKLATINLPNEVKSIGYCAFYNCSSLTSIIIPESIEYIGDCAFDGCSNLKYNEDTNGYYLGNGSNPFVYLINIKNTDIVDYTINESTKIIGDSAFSGCSNLVRVTLGNNLRCIGSSAFEDSKGLSEVYIMDIGTWCKISFGDRYSNPIAYNAKLYLNNVLLTDLIVPDGITVIKNYAFYNYDSLISVELPIGVTGIGDYAFYDCDNLTSVALLQGSMSIGNYAFYECVNLTRVTISAGATSVGDYAFYYCGLEKMIFSDNATSVGTYAFYCCQDLTNVTFPNSLESIGSYSFGFCTSLTRVEIPDSVTRLGTYAFAWCKALTSVTIGNGLEKIEDYAFLDCIKLTSVKIGNNVTSIGKYAFSGCALQIVEIPKSVTYIGTYAFDGCSGLERVVLENTSGWKCYRGNTLIADLPYGQSAWFALALKDTNAYSDCKWLRS